ncbi:hypothetical protein EIN_391390 [Entamoeba invadens IP1]|uniref:LIM zinc-binding domain-containing protein n=2 Tax=Entamoeba invadens TaxID=33085 RepID=A0A0A1U5B3_ENTIV|nr:hypothetical protein EIN_391390 [Entamoeba invadens IP1]ELP89484.1 hypothetical protein EIN_391390 [Entamoeba invadens IP1]BAN42055.1 hypothetical protein, conserved [Entamoeba invadens]|eukprot:XP_004256255.1 hypothetical protein EIN_391390 [Entamoeba invadens IP1]
MSVVCFKCKQSIEEGIVISACGKTYHPSHFLCKGCGGLMKDGEYQEIRKNPYCIGCATAMGAVKVQTCCKCNKEIYGRVIDVDTKKYHPDCFVCDGCLEPFNSSRYYPKNGEIFCEKCFVAKEGLVCSSCGNVIVGKYKRCGDKKFHETCFVCSVCGDKLNDKYYIVGNTLYCQDHRHRMMGYKCGFCNELIDRDDSTALVALGRKWHKDHFLCAECKNPLNVQTARVYLEKAYCPICYNGIVVTRTIELK